MTSLMESSRHDINDEHYLRAVTDLGDTRKIVAACDICSQSGIKLVAAEVRITSELYERLIRHKLMPALDKSLSMDNMLTSERILADVLEFVEMSDTLVKVAELLSETNAYRKIISDIRLPAPLAFRLTVAKEKFPAIYRHSLLLMVVSIYLARCDRMSPQEEGWLAVAALFHDIGLLHIDPMLLDPSNVMSSGERRHLYAHPLTAYLLLCEFPELPTPIANAVLEHHEMMDGSGYPRGLRGKKISRYGQVLAVAELAAKALDSNNLGFAWEKLDVMFKLNFKKYGQGLVGHLNIFRDDVKNTAPKMGEPKRLVNQVKMVAKLFENFNHHSDSLFRNSMFDFAESRVTELRQSLFEAGFDPRNPDGLIQTFRDEPESMPEYAPVIGEAVWQFKSLVLEISRQWPEVVEKPEAETKMTEYAWFSNMQRVLSLAELDS